MTARIRTLFGGALVAIALMAAPSGNAQATGKAATKTATKTAKTTARTTAKATKATAKETKAAAKETAKETAKTAKTVATVTCADGTTSAGGRGACSSHGGIKGNTVTKINPAVSTPMASPTAVAKASPKSAVGKLDVSNNVKAGAIALCKDGTYSHSKVRTGACSGHGGVTSWL